MELDLFLHPTDAERQADRRRGYGLDEDLMRGFKRAVDNGQPRMALEHLVEIVKIQNATINDLIEAKRPEGQEKPNTEVPKPPSRARVAKEVQEEAVS